MLSLLFIMCVRLSSLSYAADLYYTKDKTTVRVLQTPSHSTTCKGVTSTTNSIRSCAITCDGTLSAIDGPCEWFAYDSHTSHCHLCFPYSRTLPSILDFNSTTSVKIFSPVNMTCKKISSNTSS